MAKTIEDMANRYCEGSSFEDAVMEKPAYIAGANAVLEEIEKELPKSDKILNDYGKALVWRLKNCIEQLKK